MNYIKIAIDGHSSCGKSTLAKSLAKHFGFVYIDTGAMYRAITLYALQNGLLEDGGNPNIEAIAEKINDISINFKKRSDGTPHTILNGIDVESEIRKINVSRNVSTISALKIVRDAMVKLQREMAGEENVVMDGRDIGTVVFPNAQLKIFLTAKDEVRAQRRYDELVAKGQQVSFDEILINLRKRDLVDSTRKESPLRKADDAVLLDNSDLTKQQQFDFAVKLTEDVIKQCK